MKHPDITCGAKGIKTFIYHYRSPLTNKLVQISIGHYPTVSLAEARLKCAELKSMRANGHYPATEQRERKAEEQKVQQDLQNQPSTFTLKDVVELYLTQHIEGAR